MAGAGVSFAVSTTWLGLAAAAVCGDEDALVAGRAVLEGLPSSGCGIAPG